MIEPRINGRGPLIYGFNTAMVRAVARTLNGQAGSLDLRHQSIPSPVDGRHHKRRGQALV